MTTPAGPAASAAPEPAHGVAERPWTAVAAVAAPAAVRAALLRWYDAAARPLPWRADADPYRVWVAEVMLQQTRVEVVLGAYARFLRRFPDLASLARAREESVLAAWSGLGYYARARSLHRAARLLHGRGAGAFPRDARAAAALPGVGPYTLAAVLSIAYGEPLAAVDANVARVLSRLGRLPRPDARGEPHRALAERLLDRARPGDWNQALMELGETVCLPRAPRCEVCPIAAGCAARLHGEVALYPLRRPRRATERVAVELTVLRDRSGRVLLERGAFPYLPHLWLPPARLATQRPARATGGAGRTRAVGRFRHAILHRLLDVEVRVRTVAPASLDRAVRARATASGPARAPGVERRIFARAALGRIGRSSLLVKALALGDGTAVPRARSAARG